MRKRILIYLFLTLIFLYIIASSFFLFSQKSQIYYPYDQDFDNCHGFEDYEKINFQGTRFYYKENSENVLVYYHGNEGSACDRSSIKHIFEENTDSSLIFVEYAGYSGDNKKPSQKLILKDVENIHDFIEENSFTNITLYGESLGTGAASYHTSLGNVDSLILVTPFYSLNSLVQSKYPVFPSFILLTEKYDNNEWLQDFEGRLLILHGDSDNIIPYKSSEKLFNEILSENKEYILIPEGEHGNLWNFEVFIENIIEFIDNR